MPQIKEYSQRTDVAGPRELRGASDDSFGADIYQGVRQAGNTIASLGDLVERRAEQSEISDSSVKLSEAHAQFTNQLHDELQKGTIDSDKFMQKYDEYMSKASEGISTKGGQEYFNKASASLRAHMLESSHAAQVEVAGARQKQEYLKTRGNYEATLMSDPTAINRVKEVHNAYLEGLVKNGSLPYEVAQQLKREGDSKLTEAEIRGWIDLDQSKDPKQSKVLADIKAGKWDAAGLDGDMKKQLEHETLMKINANRADEERQRALENRVKEQDRENAQYEYLDKIYNNGTSAQEILKDHRLSPTDQRMYINLIHKTARDEAKNDPTIENQVYRDIMSGKVISIDQITNRVGDGLDARSANRLVGMFAKRKTPEGMNEQTAKMNVIKQAEKTLLKNPMLGPDPEGQRRLNEFTWAFEEQYNEARTKGKSVKELTDPGSPDYLGNLIRQYTPTAPEIMKARMESLNKKKTEVIDAKKYPEDGPYLPGKSYGGMVYKGGTGGFKNKANWEKTK